jgi:hypothetical protein
MDRISFQTQKNQELAASENEKYLADKYSHIPGWGIDADPQNEPNYPMKHWNGADHNRSDYEKAPQQPQDVELLKSNERPRISRVFGNTVPPSGLSGKIRRYAFKYSESNWGHWLPLMLADRINVVEGIIEDMKRGIFPNFWKEHGWSAEWKHKPQNVVKKLAIRAAIVYMVVRLITGGRKRKLIG